MLTLFEKNICDCNKCKVMQTLVEGREFDYTITEIADEWSLSRTAIRKAIKELLVQKRIFVSRPRRYKIMNNDYLIKIFDKLILDKVIKNA